MSPDRARLDRMIASALLAQNAADKGLLFASEEGLDLVRQCIALFQCSDLDVLAQEIWLEAGCPQDREAA